MKLRPEVHGNETMLRELFRELVINWSSSREAKGRILVGIRSSVGTVLGGGCGLFLFHFPVASSYFSYSSVSLFIFVQNFIFERVSQYLKRFVRFIFIFQYYGILI
ncbi:hypothetical protein VIGAN_05197700 [Vigna angularis var. angularis]|uniref:Uncharacterized protein n=1 Tax=Vigna angularis var. angularis TaxID=157739 RepID=A0A0S3S6L1_PHAAN|nr:hypothetical protein VIGAN_05197700 [Vigna angularis var. angularis]